MIIIGIDPGTATTGYGIIKRQENRKTNKRKWQCLKYGLIKTDPALNEGKRLKKIYNKLNHLIKEYQPEALAVEKIYFFKNLKTAIPVAQAKGIILLNAARKKIPVYQFTPLQVKMAVTGYGRAKKKQVQKMIKKILKLKKLPPNDAADALGLALCYTRTI